MVKDFFCLRCRGQHTLIPVNLTEEHISMRFVRGPLQ